MVNSCNVLFVICIGLFKDKWIKVKVTELLCIQISAT